MPDERRLLKKTSGFLECKSVDEIRNIGRMGVVCQVPFWT